MGSLHTYFQARKDTEIETWAEREGLVWVTPESFPSVLKELCGEESAESLDGNAPTVMVHLANDERKLGRGFVLYLVLHWPEDFTLTLAARGIEESFPSLTTVCPALNWAEREVQDLFGLRAEGHPDPRKLVLHPGWPEDFFPLRKEEADAKDQSAVDRSAGKKRAEKESIQLGTNRGERFEPHELTFSPALGEGTFEVPVGPIHAGIIEPGHFRFQTIGETILHLEAQLFYTHKGVEKLLEGKDLFEGLKVVERLCGVCTVSHSLAYCEAVEKLAEFQPEREVLAWRTVLAELERLYNHTGDIGNLCAGVGFSLGNANGLQNKEKLQRLNQEFFGHRFLRGTVVPGDIKIRLTDEQIETLQEQLRILKRDFEAWIPLILEHDGFRQRAVTTGVLKRKSALDLGVTGPAARASGVAADWRQSHDYLLYQELEVVPQVETGGDVWSRLMVRVREVRQSYELLERLLDQVTAGREESSLRAGSDLGTASATKLKEFQEVEGSDKKSSFRKAWEDKVRPYSFAWGCAESPRGTDFLWLMVDEERKIYRCRIRSAAYANWPAVPLAVLGNIVPDFPLINKSFELCYSCCDR